MNRDKFTINGRFNMGLVFGRMSISTPAQQAEHAKLLTPEEEEQARNHVRILLQVKRSKK